MGDGSHRLIVFGSLVQEDGFAAESDIDMAAEGIAPQDFFAAMALREVYMDTS